MDTLIDQDDVEHTRNENVCNQWNDGFELDQKYKMEDAVKKCKTCYGILSHYAR